jgi:hypothetical protein
MCEQLWQWWGWPAHLGRIRGAGDSMAGLTNSAYFIKIQQIRTDSNSKIIANTVHCFKISKKIKINKKYVKN